jgi:hypothetical protein
MNAVLKKENYQLHNEIRGLSDKDVYVKRTRRRKKTSKNLY